MAIRTLAANVVAILVDHYDTPNATDLTAFIATANSLTDAVSTADTGGILSSGDLELIERWLAAHFYGHADQMTQSEGGGGANASFQGQTAMFFESTQYGQTALVLDRTGELARLQKQAEEGKRSAGMTWLGTRIKYDDSETSADQ